MTTNAPIEIPLSKSKIIKGLLGSTAFVAIGLWLLIRQPHIGNPVFDNALVKYGASIASIIFFGFAAFFFLKKLGDKKPGMIINNDGLYDNSSAATIGLIPWDDIIGVSVSSVMNQQFLIICLKNPEQYIAAQTNLIKKKSFGFNYKNYGSPIAISANTLQCNLYELKAQIENKIAKQKSGEVSAE
ncbi:STM3941 family protein [Mucilaginibacter kameinonensis]|uniref:STM3941 family protein n=1 Tax=Mucilaginibacter kameinonensis TaxID=452286 RepID=UPI000EF7FB8D|nr:STM3941 family protein [Mucilaginibacter kameinonensis]